MGEPSGLSRGGESCKRRLHRPIMRQSQRKIRIKRTMNRSRSLLCALLVTVAATDVPAAGDITDDRLLREADKGENWLRKSGNARSQHYSPLRAISDRNVDELGLAWSRVLPIKDGIAGTPIVVDGVIYLAAAYSIVFAVDATDGRILWSYDPKVRDAFAADPTLSWVARANRGVAVGHGSVFVATADCRLIALDPSSGKERWSEVTCNPALGYSITDSPYVGAGMVFVGNAGSESGEKNRGYVTAYDAKTGAMQWRFFTVPSDDPAENTSSAMKMAAQTWSGSALKKFGGGGSNWNGMTYDPESGLLFFGTAGALPYLHNQRSPKGGDNLFTSSVLAINAETGEYVWHYQTVPEDSWEYNATMNIVLADLTLNGELRETLLIAPKNGFQYVLDRHTGELLGADKFAKVTWATHINLETGRPVLDPDGKFWELDEGETVAVWPNMWGAHSWNPMAYSPVTKLVYIPVIDVPSVVTNYADGDYDDTLEIFSEVDGESFSPGKLVAYDPVSHAPRWTIEHELPFNGGILATGGNLVFQGDARGRFSAYDAGSGEQLWSVPTGSAIGAAPASYAIDGTQYILLPVGLGGGLQYVYPALHATDSVQGPTRLLAFSLEGELDGTLATAPERTLPPQPTLDASAETVAYGEAVYAEACGFCHGKGAVARAGGSVPDLRYANNDIHAQWHAIVVGGSLAQNGMPAVGLDLEASEAVRAYVLSKADALRDARD